MDLKDEHEGLLKFLYLCPVGLVRTDLDGVVDMLNPKAAQLLLPISRTATKLDNLFEVLQDQAPEIRNLVSNFTAPFGTICEDHQVEIRKGTKGVAAILAVTVIKLGSRQLMTVLQDVTLIVEQERALRSREQRLEAIFNGVRDYAIYSLDEAGRIETWNSSAERLEGYTALEAIGQQYGLDYPPERRDPLLIGKMLKRAGSEGWNEDEGWRVRRSGERFWASTMVSVLRESDSLTSRALGFSVITRDISDRKHTEDTLRHMATTDYLTGVYNRRYFFEHAPTAVAGCAAEGKPLSVVMIDADRFKSINDRFGHEFGDRALKTLAGVCARAVGDSDIVARFGGEEFAILLLNKNRDAAAALAGDIRSSVEKAGGGLTASLGVAEVDGDVEEALRAADLALYQAKAKGRNCVVVAGAA